MAGSLCGDACFFSIKYFETLGIVGTACRQLRDCKIQTHPDS